MRLLLILAVILSAPGTLSTIVLEGGSDPSEGDVFIDGYSVWHYPWNSKLATVACRMLGYKFGLPTDNSFFGSNSTGTNLIDISCNGMEESLLDCTYSTEDLTMDWGAAGVMCKDSNELSLELQGGSVASEGNVFIDGLPMSSGTWNREEANTVCRLLGYKHGIPTHSKFGPTSIDPVNKVECNGSEKLLSDCIFSGESYYKAAGVVCLDSNQLKVELSGGHGPSEGNVLVNGKPVCEWNWDKRDALVTCRMLGFPFGFPTKKSTSDRKNQIYDSMFSKWGCDGTEDSLFDCPFTGDSCEVFNDAGVDCKGYDYGANMTVRLEGGFVPSEGNLLLNDQYVCGYKWSSKEATTACRMLGYKSGYPARQKKSKFLPPPPNRPIPYLFSSVKCSEEEESLLDCMYEYRAHGSTCEDGYSVAGVSCFDTETIEVLELQGGPTPMEGDVFLNGRPICDYGWNASDAAIVCRTLGYKFGASTTKSQYDDNCLIMRCKGDEDSLFKCKYYDGDGDETAGVICSDTPGPTVEMRGGSDKAEGNVYTNKRAVCATGWDEKEAAVICRMKGHSHGFHTINSFFGRADKSQGYSEVVCDGTETSIANCTYKEKRYCDDYEVGGVICTNTMDTAELVELKGGTVPSEGNVYIMGRPVCWNWYGNWRTQAGVVCRMLGFPSGFYVQNSRFGLVPNAYKWDEVKCGGSEESFFGCEFKRRKKCDNDEVDKGVGVICRNTTNPTIELKGGTSSSEGNVLFGGEPICSDYWDSEDASVVCRMLGFKFGYPTNSSKFGPVTNKFIFGEMHCNGKEESLFECDYNFVDNCNSKDGAGAICKNTPPFSLELRGGSSSSQGKVFVNNRPMCDYGWDAKDATVACKTLGYSFGIPTSGSIFGNVPVDFIFKQVACNGSETSLANCGHDKCTSKSCGSYCYGYNGAGVICQNTDHLPIDLRGGNSTSEGNVFVNGKPVCDDGWGTNEAAVTCRLLGFKSGFAATNSKFGSIPNISFFGDVRCVGTEDSLFDCNYNSDTCSEKRGAGVICQNNTDFLVELRGGTVPSEGNVFVNNKPVCDYSWNAREASVVCRMFGYPFGFHTTKSRFGPVPDLFIFEDVFCQGSEESLEQCGYGGGNCKNPSGAGVICLDYDYAANATIELRGGSVPSEGNVYINDKPVCSNGWNWGEDEGITACHMLGYVSGIHTSGFTIWKDAPLKFEKASYSIDQGKASLDTVNCNGPQKSLFDCEYYLEKHCKGGARGVICLDSRNLTLELRGGSVPSEGNLFVNGKPVCDDDWKVRGAIVACRMLGYAFGTPTNESRFGSVPEVFILKNVNCQGYEQSLLDCSYSGDNCKANEGAGVVCQSAADLALDLTGWTDDSGLDGDYGGNVVLNGETVCDSSWDDKDANVVCRSLGYSSGTSTRGSKFGPGLSHIISNVDCDGTEDSLLDCKYWAIDDNRNYWCGKDKAAGVVCRK